MSFRRRESGSNTNSPPATCPMYFGFILDLARNEPEREQNTRNHIGNQAQSQRMRIPHESVIPAEQLRSEAPSSKRVPLIDFHCDQRNFHPERLPSSTAMALGTLSYSSFLFVHAPDRAYTGVHHLSGDSVKTMTFTASDCPYGLFGLGDATSMDPTIAACALNHPICEFSIASYTQVKWSLDFVFPVTLFTSCLLLASVGHAKQTMAPSSMFPDTRDNDTTYNSMKAVVDRLRLDTKGTCGHHELAFFPNPSPDYATSRTPGIISFITSILIATQMPSHDTDMQVIYRELDDASRSLNRRLQTLALLALSVYDSQCESNPYVGAKFRGLVLESCGAVFTIIVAAKRIQAGENSHDDTLPISDREANELQDKLHCINLCARDLTARGPLEAIIRSMLDLVQIREYRAFMRKIIVDERFCLQVPHLASRERIVERRTNGAASSDDPQLFTQEPPVLLSSKDQTRCRNRKKTYLKRIRHLLMELMAAKLSFLTRATPRIT
ncbi:hypothetical protein Moror_2920 [Moniliophthora roreri MCA 2997]|uniref:Uncharacterized protein n=1 Tax=Moniliophthora roreri (strain MCA 2997) TaxID=1381753 RepID=V2XFE6_MONRO|nr:hypothetical protein Moror_2920 [Moniliophthora roreri MCA 2997]